MPGRGVQIKHKTLPKVGQLSHNPQPGSLETTTRESRKPLEKEKPKVMEQGRPLEKKGKTSPPADSYPYLFENSPPGPSVLGKKPPCSLPFENEFETSSPGPSQAQAVKSKTENIGRGMRLRQKVETVPGRSLPSESLTLGPLDNFQFPPKKSTEPSRSKSMGPAKENNVNFNQNTLAKSMTRNENSYVTNADTKSSAKFFKIWLFIDEILKCFRVKFEEFWSDVIGTQIAWDELRKDLGPPWPFRSETTYDTVAKFLDNFQLKKFKTKPIETWDVSLLTNLCETICKDISKNGEMLEKYELMKINCTLFRNLRNELLHQGEPVLSDKKYSDKWDQLKKIAKYFNMPDDKVAEMAEHNVTITTKADEENFQKCINEGDWFLNRQLYHEALRAYQIALYISEINGGLLEHSRSTVYHRCSEASKIMDCPELAAAYRTCFERSLRQQPNATHHA